MEKAKRSGSSKATPRATNAVARTFARSAVARLSRAIDTYWKLGDPFAEAEREALSRQSVQHGRRPVTRRPVLAELAVDVSGSVEVLISALRLERRLSTARNKPLDLLKLVFAEPEVDERLGRGADRFLASFSDVRDARNAYLHRGDMPPDRQSTTAALRDTIELGLRLAATFPLLREGWNDEAWHDIDESLWRFVGQPEFVTEQVRRAFSGRHFRDLRAHLRIGRHGDTGRFFIGGAVSITGEIEQYRWGFTGKHAQLLKYPGVHAEVGVVAPPPASNATEHGEEIVEGELELVARDLPVEFDGFSLAENPLLEPIYLYDKEDSPWSYGPGDVKLAWLKLTMPYRARAVWYPTPEPRLHILSEFLECEAEGIASGELHFSLPGHAGKPAFKGKALIQGRAGPAMNGRQLAEWRLTMSRRDQLRRAGVWSGVSRFALQSDLLLDITFPEF